MQIKSIRSSAAALCVSAFTLIMTASTSPAGGFDFLKLLGFGSDSSMSSTAGTKMSRGSDDPAGHDAKDDRRGPEPQPGDDRGRHRGHGR